MRAFASLVRDSRPEWILLLAAYTDVDGCESNRDLAFAVNCEGAVNVAEAAREAGSRLLFVSTDYVFDGSKAIALPNQRSEDIRPASMARAKRGPRNGCSRFCPRFASPERRGCSATEASAFPRRF